METAINSTAVLNDKLLNENGKNFLLFNQDWLLLQSYVASCLKLPIAHVDFEKNYGKFPSELEIENCISSIEKIQGMSKRMGNPTMLLDTIASNPDYVSGNQPPVEIYAHCIWLAGNISVTADSFHYTYNSLSDMFIGTPEENAETFRTILTGKGGLLSSADQMLKYTRELQIKLGLFQKDYKPAEDEILKYCKDESEILGFARIKVSTDQEEIKVLQKNAADAHKQWRDYTIAASSTSLGVMVLSCGMLYYIAGGLAGGLGAAASKQLKHYNKLMQQVKAKGEDHVKKLRLVLDLESFNHQSDPLQKALINFEKQLIRIENLWLAQNQQLTSIAGLDVDILGNLPKVIEMLKITQAQSQWKEISDNTKNFTKDCLVTFLDTIQYPSEIPVDYQPE